MRKFSDYLREVEELGQELGSASDDSVMRIVRVAFQKHRDKFVQFLTQLGERDPEIKDAMKGIGQTDDYPIPHGDDSHKDEVKPPTADGSSGMGNEEQ